MASTAEEVDLGHLNVNLVFVGVMKILVPCFFFGNFCGDKMVFPLLFHALSHWFFFIYQFRYICIIFRFSRGVATFSSFVITRIIKLVQSSTYIRYFSPGILFSLSVCLMTDVFPLFCLLF